MRTAKMLNIQMAVAVGALNCLAKAEPADHTKKARICSQLARDLVRHCSQYLPLVTKSVIEIGSMAIKASEEVCLKIVDEEGVDLADVLVNLAAFCMDELPIKERHKRQLQEIVACYDNAGSYEETRLGHRVWQRLETEIAIQLAMKEQEENDLPSH